MVDKALIQRKLTLLKDRQSELRGYKLKQYRDFLKTPHCFSDLQNQAERF